MSEEYLGLALIRESPTWRARVGDVADVRFNLGPSGGEEEEEGKIGVNHAG